MIVPGRILLVDDAPTDNEKAVVEKVMRDLREQGESVLFSPSIPENETMYENVRLLIIDLLLAGTDMDRSLEIIATILDKLNSRTAFFVVAVWTKATRAQGNNIVADIKNAFKNRTQKDLAAVILDPFGKNISPSQLMKRIQKAMKSLPQCALLYEVEASVEYARDRALSDIISTADIPIIIEAMKEEIAGETLARDMINLYLKILGRHSVPSKQMQKCVNRMAKGTAKIDPDKYGRIHNLRSYYEVKKEESVWTGDVLAEKKRKGKYAVVISPACDFAQRKRRKMKHIKILPAFRINHQDLLRKDYLKKLAKQLNIKEEDYKALQRNILTCNLPERYYSLTYLQDSNSDLYHLFLDFQATQSITFRKDGGSLEKAGYIRTCRIDNPLIDDLLQGYSAYSSRIGTDSTPKSVIDAAKSKIR